MHSMKLNDPWYDYVQDGSKVYEGRRYSEKIAVIKPGDKIEFKHYTNKLLPPITVEVIEVLRFPTFRDAMLVLPISEILPIPGLTLEQGDEIYKKYVSLKTQNADGVCMIKIKAIEEPTFFF